MKHLPAHTLAADRGLTMPEKLRLVLEVCLLRLVVARILSRQPDARAAVGELRRHVARPATDIAKPAEPVIARLAGSSRAVLERLPGDHRCLAQSLVLTGLLARRGIASRVVIGVRKEPRAHALSAHAWVTINGRAVSPPGDHGELVDL